MPIRYEFITGEESFLLTLDKNDLRLEYEPTLGKYDPEAVIQINENAWKNISTEAEKFKYNIQLHPFRFPIYLLSLPASGNQFQRSDLLDAALKLKNIVNSSMPEIQYFYSVKLNHETAGGRGISGYQVNGYWCGFTSGNGMCTMTVSGIDESGRGHVLGVYDIRHLKKIRTDKNDEIHILRKKRKVSWPEVLPSLIAFLSNSETHTIHVRPIDVKPPTVLGLIRLYESRGGSDDDACEVLEQMGDLAKNELMRILSERKQKKHHETVVELLEAVFPDEESARVIDDWMLRERNCTRETMSSQSRRNIQAEELIKKVDSILNEVVSDNDLVNISKSENPKFLLEEISNKLRRRIEELRKKQ